jgi:hypothetical protein
LHPDVNNVRGYDPTATSSSRRAAQAGKRSGNQVGLPAKPVQIGSLLPSPIIPLIVSFDGGRSLALDRRIIFGGGIL